MRRYPHRLTARPLAMIGGLTLVVGSLAACGSSKHSSNATAATSTTASSSASSAASSTPTCCKNAAELSLYSGMRDLWAQHMEWTYATIAAFASNSPALTATLDRLLQNQVDIGNAIKPIYGDAAGGQLTALLHTHIMDYVPILKDAKAGNQASLQTDIAAVMANGVAIGKFLESANPNNWPAPQIEQMMNVHNQQTLKYATDQLQGNYAASITDYGTAEAHMYDMGDMLTNGIIAQYPAKFTG